MPTTNPAFGNTAARGTLELTKNSNVAGVTANLENAVFEVKDGSNVVAHLAYNATTGKYDTLDTTAVGLTEFKTVNGATVAYVLGGKLLAGSYTIHEATAPAGYYAAADQTVKIDTAKAVNGVVPPVTLTVTDRVITADLPLVKTGVQTTDKTTVTLPLQGVTFTLMGTDVFGNTVNHTKTTDEHGAITFTGLYASAVGGYYTLTETALPDGAETGAVEEVYHVTVDAATGVVTAERWTTGVAEAAATVTATAKLQIKNTIKQRSFSFIKKGDTDEAGNPALQAGVQFTLTGANGTFVSAETGADGVVLFKDIPYGSYRMTETKTPENYIPAAPIAVVVGTDGSITIGESRYDATADLTAVNKTSYTVTNALYKLDLTLNKVNSQNTATKVSGASYALYRAGAATPLQTATTVDGTLTFTGLVAGASYRLAETAPAPGYHQSSEEVTFTVAANGTVTGFAVTGNTGVATLGSNTAATATTPAAATLTWKETPFSFKVLKMDSSNHALIGATLEVHAQADCSDAALYTGITTIADGMIWQVTNADKLRANTTYYIKETSAPAGYTLADVQPFTTGAAELVTLGGGTPFGADIYDAVADTTITLNKKGLKADGTGLTDLLDGAVFTLSGTFANGTTDAFEEKTFTGLTLKDGVLNLNAATLGGYKLIANGAKRYTLTETTAPTNYEKRGELKFYAKNLNGTITIMLAAENPAGSTAASGATLTVQDKVKRTSLTLTKYSNEGTNVTLNGAQFTLAAKNGTVFDGGAFASQTKTTAGNGTLTFTDIPVGEYTLTESKLAAYEENTTVYDVKVEDLGGDSLTVTLTGTGANDADKSITNTKIRRAFTFTKYGIVDESGTIQMPAGENAGKLKVLPGATFGLFADAACTAPALATAQSDASGIVTFENLAVGTYYFTETAAPTGFTVNPTVYTVIVGDGFVASTVQYNQLQVSGTVTGGTEYKETLAAEKGTTAATGLAVLNDAQRGRLTLQKVDSKKNDFKVEGATYTLKRGATKVDEQTTDADGKLTFTGLLAGETYTITETKAATGYHISAGTITFKVEDDGSITGTDVAGLAAFATTAAGTTLTWQQVLVTRSFSFTKTAITNESGSVDASGTVTTAGTQTAPLAGAAFTLTGTAHNGNEVNVTETSADSTGLVTFTDIPWGSYTLRETTTPAGFVPAADRTVTVDENGTVTFTYQPAEGAAISTASPGPGTSTGYTIVNNATRLRWFVLVKQNSLTGAYVAKAGAEYALYRTTSRGIALAAPVLVDTKTTVAGGDFEFENLLAGERYKLTETKPAPGYQLSAESLTFSVTLDGDLQLDASPVAQMGGMAALWQEQPLALQLTKKNKNGDALPIVRTTAEDGAVLGIYTAETEGTLLYTSTTDGTLDANGVWTLADASKLEVGTTYYIREDKAPNGYLPIAPQPLTLDYDGTPTEMNNAYLQKVTVTDALAEVALTLNKRGLPSQAGGAATDTLGGAQFTLTGVFADAATGQFTENSTLTLPTTVAGTALTINSTALGGKLLIADGNHSYTLAETTAPVGYAKRTPVIFTVTGTGLDAAGTVHFVGTAADAAVSGTALTLDDAPLLTTLGLTKYGIDPNAKADDKAADTLLPGVQFTLESKVEAGRHQTVDGIAYRQTQTTGTTGDALGKLTFTGITMGRYTLTETRPEGYEAADGSGLTTTYNVTVTDEAGSLRVAITDANGADITADTVQNTKIRRGFSFTKLRAADADHAAEPLAGAVFGLFTDPACETPVKTLLGLVNVTAKSDAAGKVSFEKLACGVYYVKELSAPANYALDTAVYTVYIGGDTTAVAVNAAYNTVTVAGETLTATESDPNAAAALKVTNTKKTTALTVNKLGVDPLNGSTTKLSGVAFTLTGTDFYGTEIGKVTTATGVTADGTLTFTGLTAGSYTLTETKPAVYETPAVYTVTVSDTGAAALQVTVKNNTTNKPLTVENNAVTLENTLIRRDFSFVKQGVIDEADSTKTKLLAGAIFTLQGTAGTFVSTASDANGVVTFTGIPVGTYTMTETTTPTNYETAAPRTVAITEDGRVTITADGTATTYGDGAIGKLIATGYVIVDDATRGAITLTKLNKRDGTAVATGAAYDLARVTTGTPVAVSHQVTDPAGTLSFTNLLAGETYTITETAAAPGYQLSAESITFTVSATGGIINADGNGVAVFDLATAAVTWNEQPLTLTFVKRNKNNELLAGASLAVYDNEACTGTALYTGTTTADGTLVLANAPALRAATPYWVVETDAPAGYTARKWSFTTDATKTLKNTEDGMQTVALFNAVSPVTLTLNKLGRLTDSTTDTAGIAGAQFTLTGLFATAEAEADDTLTADAFVQKVVQLPASAADGSITLSPATMDGLTLIADGTHTYTLHEADAPTGYALHGDVTFTATTTDGGKTVTLNDVTGGATADAATLTVVDETLRTTLTLTKYSNEDADGNGNATPLAGAKFTMAGTAFDGKALRWAAQTTAADGSISFTDIPAGEYTLTETRPAGYEATGSDAATSSFTVTVTDTGANGLLAVLTGTGAADADKSITNTAIRRGFSFTKLTYADASHKAEALAGATFGIYTDAACTKPVMKTLLTPLTAESDKDGTVTFTNLKCGSYFVKELTAPSCYAADPDVYTVYVGGDATLTTVPTAAAAYNTVTVNGEVLTATQTVPLAASALCVINNAKTTTFTVNKLGVDPLDGSKAPLADVVFTLTGTDFRGAALSLAPTTAATGADGSIVFSGIPAGTYTLTEAKPNGYEAPHSYKLVVTDSGKDALALALTDTTVNKAVTVKDGAATIENTLIRRSFGFAKIVKDREQNIFAQYHPDHTSNLAGVTFSLYADSACTGTVLATATSGADGAVRFNDIKAGTYFFKETAALDGAVIVDATVYSATIGEDGAVTLTAGTATYPGSFVAATDSYAKTDLVITNDVVRGAFTMVKVNESNPSQVLAGSTYGLFRPAYADDQPSGVAGFLRRLFAADASGDGLTDGIPAGYIKIAEATTDENGRLTFAGLLTGVPYYVRELKAPAGYQISEKPISGTFTLTEANKDTPATLQLQNLGGGTAIQNPDGTVTWLEPVIQLGLRKVDKATGSDIAGATLALYNAAGTELTRWVSDGTPHIIRGSDALAGGEVIAANRTYTLKELDAPTGYLLAEPVTFTVDEPLVGPGVNYIQTVLMQDEAIPHHSGGPDATPSPSPEPDTKPGATPAPGSSTPPTTGVTVPRTADDSNPALLVVLLSLATLSAAGITFLKKRNH